MLKLQTFSFAVVGLLLSACGGAPVGGDVLVAPSPSTALSSSTTLSCEGGATNDIDVAFGCTTIDVSACKDLSNVVLEFSDGAHQKFEGLTGTSGTFAGADEHEGKEIVGAWIKSGNNASGDGPGYGERFDSPADACVEESACEGPTGPIEAAFTCLDVSVSSCKDLSNVVLEFADGTHQKFEGLTGLNGTFSGEGEHAGKVLTGAWVKSGNNASGDGPGYGERFDSSASCGDAGTID